MTIQLPSSTKSAIEEQMGTLINRRFLSVNFNPPSKQVMAAAALQTLGVPLKDNHFSRGGTVTRDAILDILEVVSTVEGSPSKQQGIEMLMQVLGISLGQPFSEGGTVKARAWENITAKLLDLSATQVKQMREMQTNPRAPKIDNELGKRGEAFVLSYERKRLVKLGRLDLAEQVEDVSQQYCGFDIRSYEANAADRLIEVKTTRRDLDHTFYLTENEIKASILHGNCYWLYRVYSFRDGRGPISCLRGNLHKAVALQPKTFAAEKLISTSWISP